MMTPEEWKELDSLGDGDANPDRFEELINKTMEEEGDSHFIFTRGPIFCPLHFSLVD